jgi:hypothetical protein
MATSMVSILPPRSMASSTSARPAPKKSLSTSSGSLKREDLVVVLVLGGQAQLVDQRPPGG